MAFRSLAPSLLLAAPRLDDPNFERTVVLLGRHESDGALGWVLNGTGLHPVGELLRAADLVHPRQGPLRGESFQREARVGGPVHPESGWLVYRTSAASFSGELAVDDLAICSNPEAIRAVVRGDPPHEFRLFLGYAGWGPGQLEAEMKAGVWFPSQLDVDLVFGGTPEDLWEEAFREATGVAPSQFTHKTWGLA